MIALDSSVIMCLVEGIEPARTEASTLLAADKIACVSVVAISECMNRPIAAANQSEIELFNRFFRSSDCWLMDVDVQVARRAADLRAHYNLKTPDALHLATAIEHKARLFITTDRKGFARCVGKVAVPIVILRRDPDAVSTP